jgi:hypothetical protein
MRTTVDIPDALFRRTKALAAMRGSSLKDLIVAAIEREVNGGFGDAGRAPRRVNFPIITSRSRRKLDLSKLDFDDLLT